MTTAATSIDARSLPSLQEIDRTIAELERQRAELDAKISVLELAKAGLTVKRPAFRELVLHFFTVEPPLVLSARDVCVRLEELGAVARPETVRAILQRLVRDGELERHRRGLYRLATPRDEGGEAERTR